jgi:hypothetical protein
VLTLVSRSCLDIEFPAGIASDDGPSSAFFGPHNSRAQKAADSSFRRRVSQADLAEHSLAELLLESSRECFNLRGFFGG